MVLILMPNIPKDDCTQQCSLDISWVMLGLVSLAKKYGPTSNSLVAYRSPMRDTGIIMTKHTCFFGKMCLKKIKRA